MCKGIIYKVISPSGKVYIGQTSGDISSRKRVHKHCAFNIDSANYNTKFSRAIRKYSDLLVWKIIEENIDIEVLNERERYYIELYNSYEKGYNSNTGGDSGFQQPHTENWKREHSKRMSGDGNSFFGKHHSEELKERFSQERKGKKLPMETREKMSKSRLGEKNPMFGKSRTIEVKNAISKLNTKNYQITTPEGTKINLRGLKEVFNFSETVIGADGKYFYNKKKLRGYILCRK